MDYFKCCSSDKRICCCCNGCNNNNKSGTMRTVSMEDDDDEELRHLDIGSTSTFNNKYNNINKVHGIDDDLMDLALSQQGRVTMFIPISSSSADREMFGFWEYLNISTIIHPLSTFRIIWDSFIMLILIFTCFEIPLTLSFSIETSNIHSSYGIFVLSIDVILCIDIIFNFRTGFYDKFDELRLVSSPRKIARRYLRRWFIMDLLTSFPFEFMLPSQVELGGAPAILRAFRIVRLIRLFKLVRFFRMLKLVNTFLREFFGPKSTVIVRLCRLIAFMILAAHFAACLWYYVGTIHLNDDKGSWLIVQNVNIDNTLDSYLVSMYWSIVTLFTTGYGDIIPANQDEQLVAATVVLLGTCFFAYLIGAVGSLVAEGDRVRSIREQKFEEAQAFCANKHLPAQLTRAIMTHSSYFWKRNFVYDDIEILQSLPYGIQYDVLKYHGNKIFGKFKPFHMLPATTKGLLALKLKQFSCNKGFPVYRHGDIAKEFYIQRTGHSALIIPKNKNKNKNKNNNEEKRNHIEIDLDRLEENEQITLHRSLSHIPYCGDLNSDEKQENNHQQQHQNQQEIINEQTPITPDDLKGKRIHLKRGDICGHIGFVKGQRRGTLYCKTWSEFYSLSKRDLEDVLMMEHPETSEELLDEIKKCMKTYKPYKRSKYNNKSLDGKHKLSIDLNQIKRRNSKFVSLFTEDSIERNDKILFEDNPYSLIQTNEYKEDEKEPYIQMTQQINTKHLSDSTDTESITTDSSDNESDSEHGNTTKLQQQQQPQRKKMNTKIKKRRKMGKQGGGGGNRGGGASRKIHKLFNINKNKKRKQKQKQQQQQDDSSESSDDNNVPSDLPQFRSRPTNDNPNKVRRINRNRRSSNDTANKHENDTKIEEKEENASPAPIKTEYVNQTPKGKRTVYETLNDMNKDKNNNNRNNRNNGNNNDYESVQSNSIDVHSFLDNADKFPIQEPMAHSDQPVIVEDTPISAAHPSIPIHSMIQEPFKLQSDNLDVLIPEPYNPVAPQYYVTMATPTNPTTVSYPQYYDTPPPVTTSYHNNNNNNNSSSRHGISDYDDEDCKLDTISMDQQRPYTDDEMVLNKNTESKIAPATYDDQGLLPRRQSTTALDYHYRGKGIAGSGTFRSKSSSPSRVANDTTSNTSKKSKMAHSSPRALKKYSTWSNLGIDDDNKYRAKIPPKSKSLIYTSKGGMAATHPIAAMAMHFNSNKASFSDDPSTLNRYYSNPSTLNRSKKKKKIKKKTHSKTDGDDIWNMEHKSAEDLQIDINHHNTDKKKKKHIDKNKNTVIHQKGIHVPCKVAQDNFDKNNNNNID